MNDLSRREREILNILYRLERATAAEIHAAMVDPPTYTTVRSLLRQLEEKERIRHALDGPRFVYRPVVSRKSASRSAARQFLATFFNDSLEDAVVALLDIKRDKLSPSELKRLAERIQKAKREKREKR